MKEKEKKEEEKGEERNWFVLCLKGWVWS